MGSNPTLSAIESAIPVRLRRDSADRSDEIGATRPRSPSAAVRAAARSRHRVAERLDPVWDLKVNAFFPMDEAKNSVGQAVEEALGSLPVRTIVELISTAWSSRSLR